MASPKTILIVIALDTVKLFGLYTIPFMCLQAIDICQIPLLRALLLAALTHVISSAIPNVAGMGPYEVAFMLIFSNDLTAVDTSSALILYRLSTYFAPFLISTAVCFIMHLERHRIGKQAASIDHAKSHARDLEMTENHARLSPCSWAYCKNSGVFDQYFMPQFSKFHSSI